LLQAFPDRIVNIHPSLLPAFKGLRAWEQALAAGVRETGCTVHLVNEKIDAGRIIAQKSVPILFGDTPEVLHARIQVAEHELFPAALAKILKDRFPSSRCGAPLFLNRREQRFRPARR
jgi:phosphoribosylglycinamide formyltransferase-1